MNSENQNVGLVGRHHQCTCDSTSPCLVGLVLTGAALLRCPHHRPCRCSASDHPTYRRSPSATYRPDRRALMRPYYLLPTRRSKRGPTGGAEPCVGLALDGDVLWYSSYRRYGPLASDEIERLPGVLANRVDGIGLVLLGHSKNSTCRSDLDASPHQDGDRRLAAPVKVLDDSTRSWLAAPTLPALVSGDAFPRSLVQPSPLSHRRVQLRCSQRAAKEHGRTGSAHFLNVFAIRGRADSRSCPHPRAAGRTARPTLLG